MSDQKYEDKFREIQSYLPFLRKVIDKLEQCDRNEDSPRKAQLEKMQMLYDLLTVNKDRLRLETLLKCEGIIKKLQSNMEKSNDSDVVKLSTTRANKQDTSHMLSGEIIDITGPESPPQQVVEDVEPVLIPTDGKYSPLPVSDKTNRHEQRYHKDNSERRHHHDKKRHERIVYTRTCETNALNVDTIDLVCDSPPTVTTIDGCQENQSLTSTHMSHIIKESLDSISPSSSNLSISNIGTRRPPKELPKKNDNPQSSDLESVRKKLAMISKLSPQFEESSPPPPRFEENPPAPPPFTTSSNMLNERVHVNIDMSNSYLANNNMCSANINILPSVNPHDPRLRKNAILNHVTSVAHNFESNISRGNMGFTPTVHNINITHINRNDATYNCPNLSLYQREDPRLTRSTRHQPSNYNNSHSNTHVDGMNSNTTVSNCNRSSLLETPMVSLGYDRASGLNYCKTTFLENPTGSVRTFAQAKLHNGPDKNNVRFNAFRNDKTERDKYFESKKPKQISEPRTYGEFKAAQARAAAEEAAKKANFTKIDDSKQTLSSSNSSLDKLYRSSNFSTAEFSNKLTSFKIPKKPTTSNKTSEKDEKHISDKPQENENVRKNDTQTGKTNGNVQKSVEVGKEKDNIKKINTGLKKETEIHKNTDLKKTSNFNECGLKHNIEAKKVELDRKENKTTTDTTKKQIITDTTVSVKKCELEEKKVKKDDVIKPLEQKQQVEISLSDIAMNNIRSPSEKCTKNIETICNEGISIEVPKLPEVNVLKDIKLRRILARRCSMITYESAPEVDKDKLFTKNAFAYEDIQDKKILNKNKALADIFRKTDDNCTVSTENIITGKRRTRTTVNFNEVQQAKAVFKQNDLKKDASKLKPSLSTSCKKPNDIENAKEKNKINNKITSLNSTSLVEGNDNGSSRSAKARSITPTIQSDDKGKKEMLENFVLNLSKPNVDKKYVFSLLEQILDSEKMKLLKQIINDGEESSMTLSSSEVQNNEEKPAEESELGDVEQTSNGFDTVKANTSRRKFKKRNELDRLNDDIRDMFICEGVLTATGRRMCTLVAAEQERETTTNKSISPTAKESIDPRIRKSRVILTPVNLTTFQRLKRNSDGDTRTSCIDSESTSRNELTKISETFDPDSNSSVESSPRTMPTLKPNTPIKMTESENTNCRKLKMNLFKIKPCPKSKKLLAMAKANKCTNKMKNKIMNGNAGDTKNNVKENKSENDKPLIKNVNPNWHAQSNYVKYCIICKTHTRFLGAHYKEYHGEHYTSRLDPGTLQKYKRGIYNKPVFSTTHKKELVWFYKCPFCLKYIRSSLDVILLHIGTHTGEYKFECSKCHKGVWKRIAIQKHIKSKNSCDEAHIIDNTILFSKKLEIIKAHVCHLCNFIQLLRVNLDRHYLEQHSCEPNIITSLGYTINLIMLDNIPHVHAKKATLLEEEIYEQSKKEIVINDESESDESANCINSDHSLLTVLDARSVHDEESVNSKAKSAGKKRGRPKLNDHPNTIPTKKTNVKIESCHESSVRSNLDFDKEKSHVENSNVNAFMPTRDTNDSPTLAQNLRTIEQEEAEANNADILSTSNASVSIAERLSQRIKKFSDHEIMANSNTPIPSNTSAIPDIPLDMIDDLLVENSNTFIPSNPNAIPDIPLDMIDDLLVENEVLKESNAESSTIEDANMSTNIESKTLHIKNDNIEQDDDNWEDIEIIKPGPSTSSSIASSGSRDSRNKNKQLFQKYNRFCNSIGSLNKFKKFGNKKKSVSATDMIEGCSGSEKSVDLLNTANNVETKDVSIPFRPMIVTLEELLSDTPTCNNPVELVPELAPLEPLKDVNDAASNNVDIVPRIATTVEKMLTTQQTKNPNEVSLNNFLENPHPACNPIQNIGYLCTNNPDGYRFYCLSEKCTFIYSSEAIGLENHYLSEHTDVKWSGYCGTCKEQIYDNQSELPLPFSRELQHVFDVHIVQLESNIDNKPESTKKEIVSKPTIEMPRIKFRKLSGDCLSTTPTNAGPISVNDVVRDVPSGFVNLTALLNERSSTNTMKIPLHPNASSSTNEIIAPMIKNVNNKVTISMIPSTTNDGTNVTSNSIAIASSCSLQIAKVISLSDSSPMINSTTSQSSQALPKISNVCSLNTEEVVGFTGSLWSNQIQNECIEMADIAARSSTAVISGPTDDATSRVGVTDSPGPVIVSETVPVAQAKTGNFLITQTVSTQYNDANNGANDPQLDINISIASSSAQIPVPSQTNTSAQVIPNTIRLHETTKSMPSNVQPSLRTSFVCMGNGCSYQTRVMVAMKDHIQFHERRNFNFNQRDYMRCSVCDYLADDVEDYFKHAKKDHQRGEDFKISDGKIDVENKFKNEFIQTIKEIISLTGVKDSKLYRCVMPSCNSVLTESTYYSHLTYHSNSIPNSKEFLYKCLYCSASYQRPAGIKAHIKSHARHRYFCYLCMLTAANADQLQKHFSENHVRTMNLHTAILLKQLDLDNEGQEKVDYLVASNHQLTQLEVQQFRERLIINWQRRSAELKTHFKPSEINMLPSHPIFTNEVHCNECLYKTKVRTNMWRHLQMHLTFGTISSDDCRQPVVASVDPVNPVPCLISNERHFDKMTNLASSSLVPNNSSGNSTTSPAIVAPIAMFKLQYVFVPESRRYICGVQHCQYLTISDDIFRSHLNTLHNDILMYKCPFCQEDICKRSMSAERILQHLRFHSERLFHCEACNYLHYMKPVVERHINERHPNQCVNIITHIRDVNNTLEGLTTSQPCFGKYLKDGTAKSHKGAKTTSAGSQNKPPIDTRPLWVRNDPTRVRHIRGILMENEEESERHQQSLLLQEEEEEPGDVSNSTGVVADAANATTDSLADATSNDLFLGTYEFSCYQCDYVNRNFVALQKHWQCMHNGSSNNTINRPFVFRVLPQLKCPDCLSFTGNHHQLQLHLQSHHSCRNFAAVDPRSSKLTCGHCHVSFNTMPLLVRHYKRERHVPHDIKFLTSDQLEKLFKLGGDNQNACYVLCEPCKEIFSNTSACEIHMSSRHGDNQNVNRTMVNNIIIYCCPICMHMTGDEMTSLRHLLDHYGGFRRCHFCQQPQPHFNGYMQHCYADHREGISRFSDIYKSEHIRQFLEQMMIIFPNGLLINKKNLQFTKYGSAARITQLYTEICKTAKEPPIPRLSIARLWARKSIEAQQLTDDGDHHSHQGRLMTSTSTAAAMQLAGNGNNIIIPKPLVAKKISKRRSTVAFGMDDVDQLPIESMGMFGYKKRKTPPVPTFTASVNPPPDPEIPQTVNSTPTNVCTVNVEQTAMQENRAVDVIETAEQETTSRGTQEQAQKETELKPYSFYGTKVEPIDLSNINTRIVVAGKDTPLSLSKFQLLFKIDCRVIVEQINTRKYAQKIRRDNDFQLDNDSDNSDSAAYRHVKKACPASRKYMY